MLLVRLTWTTPIGDKQSKDQNRTQGRPAEGACAIYYRLTDKPRKGGCHAQAAAFRFTDDAGGSGGDASIRANRGTCGRASCHPGFLRHMVPSLLPGFRAAGIGPRAGRQQVE